MKELISIILPVYNGERYLDQSIRSCLQQTYSNIELIIVNDCSIDNSLAIAENFATKDKRVRVISNVENKKLPASLNLGHKVARGDFLTWTSDDNFFEPGALEILYAELISSKADIIFSNFNIIDEDGKFRREIILGRGQSLIIGNCIGACFLYTRDVFQRNDAYDENLHTVEDYDFWLRALWHSKFYHVPKVLYNFRSHGNSLSSKLDQEELKFGEKLEKSYSKFLLNLDLGQEQKYSTLFARLHQHKEINVNCFLKDLSGMRRIFAAISEKLGEEESLVLQKEIDLRLRDNLDYYTANQNIRTLSKVWFTRPQIFLRYDKRRSLRIIRKCFAV